MTQGFIQLCVGFVATERKKDETNLSKHSPEQRRWAGSLGNIAAYG
jgi:hypothetical protein